MCNVDRRLVQLTDPNTERKYAALVEQGEGVSVTVEGWEHPVSFGTVYVEVLDGKLRVLVWADPNDEDPTNTAEVEPRGGDG